MSEKVYLAVDLGAGSGRVLAGISDGKHLELQELHRFDNPGTDLPGGSFWNILGLYRDIVEGIRLGIAKHGEKVVSIGIDTWGCDYGLIGEDGNLLGLPRQYRDPRSDGMDKEADTRFGQAKIYASTGIMPAFYNTSGHLLSEVLAGSPALSVARRLLFTPDLLAYWLCGEMVNESTVASTSQLFNPRTKDWAWDVIDGLSMPRQIFGKLVPPGTIIAPLRDALAKSLGCSHTIQVVASASHDTASAVAGIPMTEPESLWLSSGTWSIMGMELDAPILTENARLAGCGNELGINGSVRFLKNIAGLWLTQECRRYYLSKGENMDYAGMVALADATPAFQHFIDPDDASFATPGDMPLKIQAFCQRSGQAVPDSIGAILRVATESLALKYRVVLKTLQSLSGKSYSRIHVGGGGIKNTSLSQSTADALGVEVLAGPAEATSCGNIITQMLAMGEIADVAAGRELIRNSESIKIYKPQQPELWSEAFERFSKFI